MRKGAVVSVWKFVAVVSVAGAVALSAAGVARADDDKQVDAIIKKAVELRRQGKDREALSELQRAATIANPPKLSAQTGLAEQALGLWIAADKHLREALDQSGDAWIKKNRHTLEESLTAVGGHLGSLDVWGDPQGAEVLVDGERAGYLPLESPIKVPAETIDLVVRAGGFVSSSRKLEISPGASVREHVVLRPVPVTPVAPPVASSAVPEAAVTPTPAGSGGEAAADESPSVFSRWWFWTIAAVVVAGGVTAAVLVTRKDSSGCTAGTCSTF
jgi:hypothetical protein